MAQESPCGLRVPHQEEQQAGQVAVRQLLSAPKPSTRKRAGKHGSKWQRSWNGTGWQWTRSGNWCWHAIRRKMVKRGGDFQQMIARMPAASLSDLLKGDGADDCRDRRLAQAAPSTVITLLGGVEPILQASSKATPEMILSPWSLGGGGWRRKAPPP